MQIACLKSILLPEWEHPILANCTERWHNEPFFFLRYKMNGIFFCEQHVNNCFCFNLPLCSNKYLFFSANIKLGANYIILFDWPLSIATLWVSWSSMFIRCCISQSRQSLNKTNRIPKIERFEFDMPCKLSEEMRVWNCIELKSWGKKYVIQCDWA